MDKKYIPSALVLYLNYFIHGIGCSILSQQVVKEMLASQWGLKDVMAVTSIAAALGLNCAQTFGTEIAKIPSQNVSVMQTYYSAGTMVALFVTSVLITKFKQVRFLVIYPAISLVMLALVYMIKTPMICYVGAFVIGYAAAGGVLQMATAVVNDLFPKIKGTITSLVMIASSLCNYTILTAAAKMTSTSVIMMNIVITAIGILLALFVNVRYGVLLKNAEEASKN